jgi:hypothetical protein
MNFQLYDNYGIADRRTGFIIVCAVLIMSCDLPVGAAAQVTPDVVSEPNTPNSRLNIETVQKKCPVMRDNDINPAIFTEYEGERVYFCCQFCKGAFEKEPEKYLAGLPQFAGKQQHVHAMSTAKAADHLHTSEQAFGADLYKWIKPVGVLALTLLAATVSLGILRRKKPKLLLKWHKRLGIATLIVALIHLIIVLIAH